jgi:hypothetical protein
MIFGLEMSSVFHMAVNPSQRFFWLRLFTYLFSFFRTVVNYTDTGGTPITYADWLGSWFVVF